MVTKQTEYAFLCNSRLILAKIHMVTKLRLECLILTNSLILAKIHMVTKLDTYNK